MLKQQIVKFIGVGIINTLFGYSLYTLFIYIGFDYKYAVFFSTLLGILFNFKTIGHFVFESHDNSLILKFFSVYAVIYIINISLIKGFSLFGMDYYLAGFLALFPCAILSFILNKKFVFTQTKAEGTL